MYSKFTRMKSTRYILATSVLLISAATFAVTGPTLPDSSYVEPAMSGEVQTLEPPVTLYSAPEQNSMSGEINISIPFNPDELDNPTRWYPDEPRNINLNSASRVPAGPVLNLFIALALSLLISGYIYTRTKAFTK